MQGYRVPNRLLEQLRVSAARHKPAQCSMYNDLTEQHSSAEQTVLEVFMLCCFFLKVSFAFFSSFVSGNADSKSAH